MGKCAQAGAQVVISDCDGSAAQTWTVRNGTLVNSGQCMDVTGQGTANGTLVELWECNGGSNQQWTQASDGSLRSAQSGKCLDDPGFSTTNGTQLEIWDCNGGSNQRWQLPAA
ncbi:ricin-type beta-trefoil lectin domain protein [Kutzneria kofuensis]